MKFEQVTLSGNSRYGNEDYARWLGISPRVIQLTPNGVDTDRFCPRPAARQQIIARHHLDPTTRIVFSAFRFSREKDPRTYLAAAEEVCRTLPNARFLLAGEGPLRSMIEDRSSRPPLAGKLILVGRTESPELYYAAADVSLLCSTHEGMPNALLEAQSCGCPVVCTASGGAAEVVRDSATGYICPVGDSKRLAERVAYMLTHNDERECFGVEARRWITSRFTLESSRDACLVLYDLG